MKNDPSRFDSPAYRAVRAPDPWPGIARIAKPARQAMEAHAKAGYPHEVCGLLLGRTQGADFAVMEAMPARNAMTERAHDRFVLHPADYRKAEARAKALGLEIVGVYHSHPDCPAMPSPTDREFAWEGWLYPILSVAEDGVRALRAWYYREDEGRFAEVRIA